MGLAATATPRPTVTEEFRRVPLDSIKPAANVRREVGDVTELAGSIKAVGILQPLIVTLIDRSEPPQYTLVAGYRRFAAAKLVKLPDVPVMLRAFTDPERLEAQLIENLQRKDIEPVEEGRAMQQLLQLGRSKEELSKRIGRTTELIGQRLALLGLPADAVEALNKHKITIDDAVQLTKLTDQPERITEVLKHSRGDIGFAVGQAVREAAREKKRAEAAEKLKAEGVTVVKLVHDWDAPPGMALVGAQYGRVNVGVAAHAKLDCHAAGITHDGQVTYVCTKPKNHPGALVAGSPSISPAEKKRRATELAERKLAKVAAEARAEFLVGLVKKTTAARSSQRFIIAQLLESVMLSHKATAVDLLGLSSGNPGDGLAYDAFPALLKDEATMLRAAFATALAIGESVLTGRGLDADPGIAANHLELLKDSGYKLNGWEREQLAEAREAVKNEAKDASEALTKLRQKAAKVEQAALIPTKHRPVARPAGG